MKINGVSVKINLITLVKYYFIKKNLNITKLVFIITSRPVEIQSI